MGIAVAGGWGFCLPLALTVLGERVRDTKSGSSSDFFFVRRDRWGFPGPGEIEGSLLLDVEETECSVRFVLDVRFGLAALDGELPIEANDEQEFVFV